VCREKLHELLLLLELLIIRELDEFFIYLLLLAGWPWLYASFNILFRYIVYTVRYIRERFSTPILINDIQRVPASSDMQVQQ
jgi:hypothetical protein